MDGPSQNLFEAPDVVQAAFGVPLLVTDSSAKDKALFLNKRKIKSVMYRRVTLNPKNAANEHEQQP